MEKRACGCIIFHSREGWDHIIQCAARCFDLKRDEYADMDEEYPNLAAQLRKAR